MNDTTLKHRTGAEAVAAKGWLLAHKWLLLRRLSQFGILGLFLLGPLGGLWIVKGNLNYSYTLNFLPLTDLFVGAQSLVSGHVPEKLGLIGLAIVFTFYLLVGGRSYCAWVCPINPVTDAAALAARAHGDQRRRPPFTQHPLLDPRHVAFGIGRLRHGGMGVDQSDFHAASRPYFWDRHGLDDRAERIPVRPVRHEPRLVRAFVPGRRRLRIDRPHQLIAHQSRQARRVQ